MSFRNMKIAWFVAVSLCMLKEFLSTEVPSARLEWYSRIDFQANAACHKQKTRDSAPMVNMACRHQTTLLAGTMFEATKLPLSIWFLALHLLTSAKTNLSALELKRQLGVCYCTAWRLSTYSNPKVSMANVVRSSVFTAHIVGEDVGEGY